MNRLIKKVLTAGLVLIMLLSPASGIQQVLAKSVKITSMTRQTLPFYTGTVARGKTLYLRPKISPSDADNQDLKWTTSNSKIATVTQNGKVKGVKKGTVIIRASATDGSKKYISWKITVGTPSTKVNVNSTSITLTEGVARSLEASVSPSTASNKKLYYKTSNSKIAKVGTDGTVTAVSEGSCTITVWAADGRSKKNVKVTVEKGTIPTNDVYLTKDDVRGSVIALTDVTLDNLYINSSVGTVQIMLYNVTVKDTLYMSDSALYTVDTNLCNIENVKVVSEKIMSTGAISTKAAVGPTLAIKENTKVGTVDISANSNISRTGTGVLNNLVITDYPSTSYIMCNVTGYIGNLYMNTETSIVALDLLNCQIERLEAHSGLTLSETVSGSNQIKTLAVDGTSAICNINIPVTDLYINNAARNLSLNLTKSVTNFYNNGVQSRVFITDCTVNNLTTSGMTAMINGQAGATVNTIYVDGASTSVVMVTPPTKITTGAYASNSTYNYTLLETGKTITP